jgi:hypothetical protein
MLFYALSLENLLFLLQLFLQHMGVIGVDLGKEVMLWCLISRARPTSKAFSTQHTPKYAVSTPVGVDIHK